MPSSNNINQLAKIKNFKTAIKTAQTAKARGKKVGLITGCFDVIHAGHIDFFRFAKRQVDFLVVGLDSDQNIKRNKGDQRPIFNYQQRAEVLSELISVDCVFQIEVESEYLSQSADEMLKSIILAIQPDYLVCHALKDSALERKKRLGRETKTHIIVDSEQPQGSSTEIIAKLID